MLLLCPTSVLSCKSINYQSTCAGSAALRDDAFLAQSLQVTKAQWACQDKAQGRSTFEVLLENFSHLCRTPLRLQVSNAEWACQDKAQGRGTSEVLIEFFHTVMAFVLHPTAAAGDES
jgi:hypothetical protein